MKKVLCLNKISPVGLATLPKEEYEITTELGEASAILVRSEKMHEMDLPENVLCVARAGAGVNNIPLDKYAASGVVVFNTPGANANAVKELTILGMLLASRDIPASMDWVKANKADPEINKTMEKAKGAFAGREIMGKTLGVIGCGAIGALVAQAAHALGMHVIGVEPSQTTLKRYADILPSDLEIVSNDELYKRADYISLHVPLLDATKGMINKDALNKMKDGVVIVNCARDALVNDDDLKEALESGKVHRYVTDFPNAKTANMEHVIAISHLGASTEEAEDNCATMACKEAVEFIENGNIINSVNYPNIDMGKKSADRRLVVLHKASLDGAEIIKTVSSCKKVVKSMSAVRGEYAVTLIDFNHDEDNKACAREALSKLDGVLRARPIH